MVIIRKRFAYIEWWKCHKYICLKKCNKELKKPKWKREKTKSSASEIWDFWSNKNSYSDKYCSYKDIEKKTHREWSNTDEFSSEMKPSDKYADNFFSSGISMIIEKIMTKMIDRTFEIKCSELCYKNHSKRKYESRGKIRINRTKIMSEPFIFRNNYKPIRNKAHNISQKYYHHYSSQEPHVSFRCFFITQKRSRIGKNTSDNIDTKCSKSWKRSCRNSCIHKSNKYKKNSHKYPCREYCIGNMESSNRPPFNYFAFRPENMRTTFFTWWSMLFSFWRSLWSDIFW